jgi:hypothetical protein
MEHYGIWSKDHFSAVLLTTREAIFDAIAYTLTNPQKDGLVPDYRKWPGLHSRPGDWLKPVRYAHRPALFFDTDKPEHAEVEYRFVPPPQLADREALELVRDVEALVRDRQAATRATFAAERRSFRGVNAVLAQDPFGAPRSRRTKGGLDPRLAAGGKPRELSEAKKALRFFRDAYRAAWKLFCAGRKAIFPGGTLLMRLRFRVPCEPLCTPWCLRAT